MSNLPPGVSGNEDAFGPQAEYDTEADLTYVCESCDAPSPEVITRVVWNGGAEDVWDCPECGHSNTRTVEEESCFDDPDYS